MNENINNHKMLLLSNKFAAQHEDSSASSLNNTARKTQSNQKILAFNQRLELLSEISSPFLKQSVYNLFSQKKFPQLQPLIRQANSNEKSKSKSLAGSFKEEQFMSARKHQPKRKQIKTEAKEFINEHLLPKKIPKLFSQSKITVQRLNKEYIHMKKSLDIIEKLKNKSLQKSHKNSRTNTEETHENSQSSKLIFNKIHNLQQKESFLNLQSRQKEVGLQNAHSKMKQSGFVTRQKKSKEIYRQQREQIKLVKEVIENSKGLNISKGMKVKNYIHFFPKIINIED